MLFCSSPPATPAGVRGAEYALGRMVAASRVSHGTSSFLGSRSCQIHTGTVAWSMQHNGSLLLPSLVPLFAGACVHIQSPAGTLPHAEVPVPVAALRDAPDGTTEDVAVARQNDRFSGVGVQRQADVERAIGMIRDEKLDAAEALLLDVVEDIRGQLTDPLVNYASTPTIGDFELYWSVHRYDEKPLVRVSGAFAAALHHLAYIEVERGDVSAAMNYIDEHLTYAPTSATALSELGQILNQARMPNQASVAYEEAVSRATYYPGSEVDLGVSLRGLGYSLIELGELAHAKDVFTRSLRVEPNNEIAQWELLYIDQLLAEQAAADPPAAVRKANAG